MKKLNKAILLALCAVLLVTASVMGTLAYLTHTTGPVTNTFTVCNVSISLDEAKVDVYGELDGNTRVTENTYKLIPGHNYRKDPMIHVNAGSEDCWVFMKLNNGLGDAAAITIHADWTLVETAADGGKVYAYKTTLKAGQSTTALFEGFTFDSEADPAQYDDETITLTGFAVQADGFDTAAKAWAAGFGNK
jgi:hypothetical protein